MPNGIGELHDAKEGPFGTYQEQLAQAPITSPPYEARLAGGPLVTQFQEHPPSDQMVAQV
jgi:hypothetical protein